MEDDELIRILEALLFVSPNPLSVKRMADAAGVDVKRAKQALSVLRDTLSSAGRAYHLKEVAGGWQFFTRPDYVKYISRLSRPARDSKLSQAALDTLTIIAYRQPVTRADIESIRGVSVDGILRKLLERGLIRAGSGPGELGRAYFYETTERFLDHFGLKNLDHLPRKSELVLENPKT